MTDAPTYEFWGVQVQHGMQLEAINRFDWERKLVKDQGEWVLNMPWGSIFILTVLNDVKERRPYVDRVQPFLLYLLGALLLDTRVALRLLWLTLRAFWRTRIVPLLRRPSWVRLSGLLHGFLDLRPLRNMDDRVERILQADPGLHAVILGHTHQAQVRRLLGDKLYVNTGTWTEVISLDVAHLGVRDRLTYATVELREGEPRPRVRLHVWRGQHPLQEEVFY